jgi:GPI mannosyltransferase 3
MDMKTQTREPSLELPSAAWLRLPSIQVILAAALVVRLCVAIWGLYIVHADEQFQYLEQAHRLVFGYGFVPWEFRFGLRNWLLPTMLAGWLEAFRVFGIDQPTFYVVFFRCLAAILSISLIYSVYTIGRNSLGEQTGRIAAVLVACWYEAIYHSATLSPEVLATYSALGAFALMSSPATSAKVAGAGVLLGLCVALRIQYIPAAGVIWLLAFRTWHWRHMAWTVVPGAAIILLAGLLDLWAWGYPFASYHINYTMNVTYGVADLFGQHSFYFFFGYLFFRSWGIYALAGLYGLAFFQRCWPVLLVIAAVLVPHSLIAHKEGRFIVMTIPLFLLLVADGMPYAVKLLRSRFTIEPETAVKGLIAAILVVCLWSFIKVSPLAREPRLLAGLELSKRPHVEAILDMAGPWYASSGFFYLHKDIPYYFPDNLDSAALADPRGIASHIIIRDGTPIPAGYHLIATFGDVVVLEQSAPPPSYRRLPTDGRNPQQPGVDDRLKPTVKSRI